MSIICYQNRNLNEINPCVMKGHDEAKMFGTTGLSLPVRNLNELRKMYGERG